MLSHTRVFERIQAYNAKERALDYPTTQCSQKWSPGKSDDTLRVKNTVFVFEIHVGANVIHCITYIPVV